MQKITATLYAMIYFCIALPFVILGFIWHFVRDAFKAGEDVWEWLQEFEQKHLYK